jgi:PTH1 family peptidyl-tRNA hydrolase
MKLIVGLGNPGPSYANTRHNLGWRAVEAYAADHQFTWGKSERKFSAVLGRSSTHPHILLCLPQTFMNESGKAVATLVSFYKISPDDILIVQDEMDFQPGVLAFRLGGGAGGHNGITSIHEMLGTKDLPRLRLGIGRPSDMKPAHEYVLDVFSSDETQQVQHLFPRASHAMHDWAILGLDKAMNIWNGVK